MRTTLTRRDLYLLPLVLVLALFGLWIYWPGVVALPILDDEANLDRLRRLSENPEYAWDYIFGNRSGSLGRPVAMATFVFEKLYLSTVANITLKFNVFLHVFNGLLVSGLLWVLFLQAGFRRAGALAALAGGLWLLSPMHVSSVLYQVQRMAMLSTSFMLLSCISYMLCRTRQPRHSWLWLLCSVICGVMALLSKENGIVILPVLLVMEVLWVSSVRGLTPTQWLPGKISLGLILLGMVGVLTGLALNWSTLQDMHGFREFTLEERLLTQTRVLWDYAGQLVWPDLSRLGLYHDDFPVSRSLWEPVTTGWSLGAWIALLGVGGYLCRYPWGRLLLLGPAVYLLGHGIEGSVFPLELYFEHRNYFPSIGLVILLGTVIGLLGKSLPELVAPLLAWLGVAIVVLAMMTSSQVQIWASPQLRVLHHVNGHPESLRANQDMAAMLAGAGDVAAASHYAEIAALHGTVFRDNDFEVYLLLLSCLAGESLDEGTIKKIGSGQTRMPIRTSDVLLGLVELIDSATCPRPGIQSFSDHLADVYLVRNMEASGSVFYSLAVMENILEQYDRANEYADRFLARTDRKSTALLMKLHFLTALGDSSGVEQVVAELRRMERGGKLTLQERDNLGYYTDTTAEE